LVPYPFDIPGYPSKIIATPLTDSTVELSPDHPEAEVRFEVSERVPRTKEKCVRAIATYDAATIEVTSPLHSKCTQKANKRHTLAQTPDIANWPYLLI
jgi:hypothetical protein